MDKAEVIFNKLAERVGLFSGAIAAERARTDAQGKLPGFVRGKEYRKDVAWPSWRKEISYMAPGTIGSIVGFLADSYGLEVAGLLALLVGNVASNIKFKKADAAWLKKKGIVRTRTGYDFTEEAKRKYLK